MVLARDEAKVEVLSAVVFIYLFYVYGKPKRRDR